MSPYHFISYSKVDGPDLAQRLCHDLPSGAPPIEIWLDKGGLHAGADWDRQLAQAIRDCESLIFLMTRDSTKHMLRLYDALAPADTGACCRR